jgi:hypothetical protein
MVYRAAPNLEKSSAGSYLGGCLVGIGQIDRAGRYSGRATVLRLPTAESR